MMSVVTTPAETPPPTPEEIAAQDAADALGRERGGALLGWGFLGLTLGVLGGLLDPWNLGFEPWFAITFGMFLVFLVGSAPFVWRFDAARKAGSALSLYFWLTVLLTSLAVAIGALVKNVF